MKLRDIDSPLDRMKESKLIIQINKEGQHTIKKLSLWQQFLKLIKIK